jgi:uncharacterized surface protein with fasciclin (FAS1) repeats
MKLVKTISALVLVGVIASCGQKEAESTEMVDSTAVAMDTTMVAETPNIVGVAAANEDFSTLVTAAANLVETLSGDGPLLFCTE